MSIFFSNSDPKLPPNRFLQFFYILKDNFLLLFYTSLTYFAFILPTIYILFSFFVRYTNESTQENITNVEMFNTFFHTGLLLIPCIMTSSFASVGMHYIIKRLVYNEGAIYKDFFIGIKLHLKRVIPLFIALSLFTFLLFTNFAIYIYIDLEPFIKLMGFIVSIILFTLTLVIKPYYLMQEMIFNNSISQILKNSVMFSLRKLFKNIGAIIASSALYISLLFSSDWIKVLNIVILIIIGGAFSTLITHLNSISILESTIEKVSIKSIYKKGLKDFEE